MRSAAVLLLASLLAAFPGARATMLYKSVDDRGGVTYSDVPPADGSRVVERRVVGAPADGRLRVVDSPWGPFDVDAALQAASQRLDLAERAFALARRGFWSVRDGLRLETRKRTAEDEARVRTLERDWLAARRELLDLRRERALAGLR